MEDVDRMEEASRCAPALLDVRAAWGKMPAPVQERIGMAAIIQAIAGTQGPVSWAGPASFEAEAAIEEAVLDNIGHPGEPGPAQRPDLACIGVQACRACGCTDSHGCAEGCEWVEPDLCSTCAERGDAA